MKLVEDGQKGNLTGTSATERATKLRFVFFAKNLPSGKIWFTFVGSSIFKHGVYSTFLHPEKNTGIWFAINYAQDIANRYGKTNKNSKEGARRGKPALLVIING